MTAKSRMLILIAKSIVKDHLLVIEMPKFKELNTIFHFNKTTVQTFRVKRDILMMNFRLLEKETEKKFRRSKG